MARTSRTLDWALRAGPGQGLWTRPGVLPAVVALALVAFPFLIKDPFWQNLAVLALISASAATAWNLLGGFAGQISFGHSIFFSIGAYATGYLLKEHDVSPWLGMLVGAGLAVVVGMLIGFPVFRLRSHYFSIATIAMQQVLFVAILNSPELGAASGLPLPLKPESLANLQFSVRDKAPYHLIALGLFGLSSLAVWLFMRGRSGNYTRAIRDDEEVARAMGVPVRRYKLYAMAISAALTALAGAVYAMYALFVDPNITAGIGQSISIALVAILGGAGSFWGPLVGAWVLALIQQGTRVSLSGSGTGLDFVVYGLLVMVISIFEPRGLVGLAARLRPHRPARSAR